MNQRIVILFVTIIQGYMNCESGIQSAAELPVPRIWRMHSFDNHTERIDWDPVEGGDENEPILGYKIKVWESPGKRVLKNETIDGKLALVERIMEAPLIEPNTVFPDSKAKIYVTPLEQTSLEIENIIYNYWYEMRIQVYTPYRDGPISSPERILLAAGKDDYRVVKYYE